MKVLPKVTDMGNAATEINETRRVENTVRKGKPVRVQHDLQ